MRSEFVSVAGFSPLPDIHFEVALSISVTSSEPTETE